MILFNALGVRKTKQDRQANLNRRREVGLLKIVTESNHVAAWLVAGRIKEGTTVLPPWRSVVRVVTRAKPVVLENKAPSRTHVAIGTNKGELVVIDVDVHVLPVTRRVKRQIAFRRRVEQRQGRHTWVLFDTRVIVVGFSTVEGVVVRVAVTACDRRRGIVPRNW